MIFSSRTLSLRYRLSIISGEPDKVKEILHSNLFVVKSLPDTVYVGTAKYSTFMEAVNALKETYPDTRYFNLRYRPYEDNIVSFQNLGNPSNIHHELVDEDSVRKESLDKWLDNGDKEKIIISLLNKEVRAHGSRQGMRLDDKTGRLYYPASGKFRSELWPTRYKGISAKKVARLM